MLAKQFITKLLSSAKFLPITEPMFHHILEDFVGKRHKGAATGLIMHCLYELTTFSKALLQNIPSSFRRN